MSCSDYNGCCNIVGNTGRGEECRSSKDGYHCWHDPITYNNGYTLTVTYYPSVKPDPTCCFCGTKESQLHGPYHPQNAPKWTQPVQPVWGTSGTITIGGNSTGSFGTLWTGSVSQGQAGIPFPTGSGYTYTIPVTNGTISTNPYIATSGYAQVVGNATTNANVAGATSCNIAGCILCNRANTTP